MSKLLPVLTYRVCNKLYDILIYSQTKSMIYSTEDGGCNGFNFKLGILDTIHVDTLVNNTIQSTILRNKYNTHKYIYPTYENMLNSLTYT